MGLALIWAHSFHWILQTDEGAHHNLRAALTLFKNRLASMLFGRKNETGKSVHHTSDFIRCPMRF